MRRFGLLLIMAVSGTALPVTAEQGWSRLDGAGIAETLTGRVVTYETGAWQDFRASGRTLYDAGRASWGYWAVRGDEYCSMWPPSDLWACYGMARQGERLRWVDTGGEITEARISGTLPE